MPESSRRGTARTLRCGLVSACLLLAACLPARPAHPLTIADGAGDLSSLNPHLTMSATMDDVGQLALAYFMRYDRAGRLEPELVTEIPSQGNGGVSRDGLTVTWHLRHGVRWSDGAPFDARDVVFTIRTILDPANAEVDGTQGWNLISRVDAPDPHTVVYHLKQPYGAIVPMSFVPAGGGPCLLPAHLLHDAATIDTAAYNAKPVGIGPFRVVAWKRGDAIEFEANPYYWRGMPRLHRITYKLIASSDTVAEQMRTGEIDIWPLVGAAYAARLRSVKNVRVRVQPSLRTTHLDFLMSRDALADAAVRRAMRLAIDRRALVRDVEHGAGFLTDSIVWPLAPVRRDDPRAVAPDRERARTLLEADGWRAQGGGVRTKAGRRLRLVLVYQSGAPDLAQLVELIRAHVRDVGIELDTRPYEHALLFAPQADRGILANAKFDLTLYSSTIVSLPDLASNFDCATAPPQGENFNRWCDPRVTPLLAEMRRSYDDAATLAAFRRLDRIFTEAVPSIQLFVWESSYAENERVTGFRPNTLTSFDDMPGVGTSR